MKLTALVTSVLVMLSSHLFASEIEDFSDTIKMFQESTEGQRYFSDAYGYAVFPTVGKGGLGIGAAHGKGQVYQAGKVTGKVSMTQVSIGFQAGGQAFSEIIFFEDKRAYDEFTQGNFEFDASASAVAITAGAQAQAGTTGNTAGASSGSSTGAQATVNYSKGMAIFIHAKGGLMYEAALAGQKFKFEAL